jgi:two-component system response regulator HydG
MLLESELFGHTQGSFTGAVKDKTGLIEAAHTGTLFLDEIGDMPITLQPKLLRVLQDHKIRKVGSTRMIPVDIRIIAATNQNLKEKIANGSFREDLYYRLSVVELSVPPLRERGNDICLLASHFLKIIGGKLNKTIHGFSVEAHKALTNHAWPGNIRELENAVEHAATLCQTDRIELSDLPVSLQRALQSSTVSTGTLDEQLFQFEDYCLRTTLEKCDYDFVAAMKMLGISLPTLYRKAKKHQLSPKAVKIIDIADTQKKTKEKSGRQPHLF